MWDLGMRSEALGSIVRQRDSVSGSRPGSGGINWGVVLLCLVPAGGYYAFLLSVGVPSFFTPALRGLTFNSMLLHLLNGSFDVDPGIIGAEGVVRNGLTYAYFGIAPALLRLPFLLSPDFASTDYTRFSCTVAVTLMAGFNLASVLTVWRAAGRPDRSDLPVLFAIAVLLGGSQIQFLRAFIYQEVVLWAAALGSVFVYLVIRGYYSQRGFTARLLAALAAVAGVCLLTRVSTALGLYVALGLLMAQLAWRALRGGGPGPVPASILVPFLPAAAILCAFAAVAALVNYGRWGNPLAFTGDVHSYLMESPDRLAHAAQYGQFNIVRLGYALAYYFVPLWAMRTADGSLLWSAFQHRTIDSVELPPSSFFISDPLTIGLAVFALVQLIRHRDALNRAVAVPVLAGLFVPIALILTFSSMTFRYRLEFYPFFDLCAFLGFGVLLARPKKPPLRAFAVAAIVGVVGAHALGLLYMLTPLGNASGLLGGMDVMSFYRSEFH
jgi:hypothetical protein